MNHRTWLVVPFVGLLLIAEDWAAPTPACCPAPPSGKPVVNADQTVVIIWDQATKTQHFIRKASFKSEADDFGFLIPSPTQPELAESGNATFPYLQKLTEPETRTMPRPSNGMSCGCGSKSATLSKSAAVAVRVLEEKLVAGFHAVILEATTSDKLVEWLRDHGYAFSPEIEAWAKPYVEQGWKITALKVAKSKEEASNKDVDASALRMTFKTDRPLFPYREPDSKSSAEALGATSRLLRIYFLADARYQGELTKEVRWTGNIAWAGKLDAQQRKKVLDLVSLPETTGPSEWWLTEFEDRWPYKVAPADLYFARDADQNSIKRPPIILYVSTGWPGDITVYIAAFILAWPVWRRRVRKQRDSRSTLGP
jgi:hypothetical protein